jgi:exodeoxyribonuclease X
MMRVIDCETTGTDPEKDHVIEIASVDLTKTAIENVMETKVALPAGVSIPPAASAVHGIIDADLEGAPDLSYAIEAFKGADYYVAHNSRFDQSFIGTALGTKPEQWICTCKVALRAFPDLASHSNQALRYWLGEIEPFGFKRAELPAHAAKADVIVTAAIFHRLLQHGVTFSQMRQWSAEPALFTTMNFGKHLGARYDACPVDYLQWMLKSDMDEDKKFSAKYWLEQRSRKAA